MQHCKPWVARGLACLTALAVLSACASSGPNLSSAAQSSPPAPAPACPPGESGSEPAESSGGAPAPEPSGSADRLAAELADSINRADAQRIFDRFSGPLRDALPLDKTREFVDGIVAAKGKLVSHARLPGETQEHNAKYRFVAERGEWHVSLHVNPEGQLLGLRFTEPPPPAPPVARSAIDLALPFRGPWYVFWGGSELTVNMHVPHPSQRRAADLVVRGPDGRTHRGDGKKNEDYYAHGQEVLAAAPGEVVTVIDGVAENEPGTLNPYFALGNAVIIRHEPALYSLYAHLQPGKIRVKRGLQVKAGVVLGLCGNSGNSSEPHLHFQLQDGPRVEQSFGIEAVFRGVELVRADQRQTPAEYTFLKGDTISSGQLTARAR